MIKVIGSNLVNQQKRSSEPDFIIVPLFIGCKKIIPDVFLMFMFSVTTALQNGA